MSIKTWFAGLVGKVDRAREYDEGGYSFTEQTALAAQHLHVERDPLYPGFWHVKESMHEGVALEFRVQTDEWIEEGRIDWAICNCPEGKEAKSQVARCAHVAAVLLAMVEELNGR